jgi:hypothetical protein
MCLGIIGGVLCRWCADGVEVIGSGMLVIRMRSYGKMGTKSLGLRWDGWSCGLERKGCDMKFEVWDA